MVGKLVAFAVVGAALYGQELKPVIDNERVTVWDVTWLQGTSAALDTVVMWVAGPQVRTAEFIPKGSRGGKAPKTADR